MTATRREPVDPVVVEAGDDVDETCRAARRVAGTGRFVVLVGRDGAALGAAAAAVREAGGRAAVFRGAAEDPALGEMLAELSPAVRRPAG